MSAVLQHLVERLRASRLRSSGPASSRKTLIALLTAAALVAVLATVMAFRPSGGGEFVGYWQVPDAVSGGTATVHIYRTGAGFAVQGADPSVLPVPYRLEGRELVPAPGYERCGVISMAGRKLCVTLPPGATATPRPRANSTPPVAAPTQSATTPQAGSTDQQDASSSPTSTPSSSSSSAGATN